MQVEITKMVYQHPWYVSSAPHTSNGRLGGSIYKPHWESSYWGRNPAFLLLTGLWPVSGHENGSLEPYWCWPDSGTQRPVQRSVQCPIAAAVAEPLDRSVRCSVLCSVLCSIRCSVLCIGASCAASCALCELVSSRILRPAWFLSSCLDFAWYRGSSLVLLGSWLWCWSLDHHVAFVQVTSCTLLN